MPGGGREGWWNLKTLRESHQGDIIALGKISVGCEKRERTSLNVPCVFRNSTFVYSPELRLLNRYNLGYFNHQLEITAKDSNRISEEHCII